MVTSTVRYVAPELSVPDLSGSHLTVRGALVSGYSVVLKPALLSEQVGTFWAHFVVI